MVMVANIFKTYVSLRTWALPWRKFIGLGEGAFLPRELRPFLRENSLLFKEITFFSNKCFFIICESCFLRYFICSLGNFFGPPELYFAPWGIYIVL